MMKALPDIAKWKMNAGQLPAAGPHPEFGVLTAFVEGSLGQHRRNELLIHLASCAHCNELVSLAAPVAQESAVLPKAKSSWRIWDLLPVPRFAVPALSAAIVLLAVFTIRPKPVESPVARVSNPVISGTETASLPPRPTGSDAAKAVARTSNSQIVAMARQPKPTHVSVPDAPETSPISRDAANVTMQSAPLPASTTNSSTAPAHTAAEVSVSSRVAAPTAGPCWKVSDAGKLQKSTTCGDAWTEISFDSPVFIRVIQSAADNIWVGGNSGALYHSPDGGSHWNRVIVPALTDDIVAIAFGTPNHGRLATANGATWATNDGGNSWKRQ